MEEKERYEWNSRFDEAIKDNQTGDIVNAVEVLNKQDKRIKELEKENQQLKQQLHDLPKKIVEEIEEEIIKYDLLKNFPNEAGYCMFNSILDTILEKYGGEDDL